MPADVTGLSAIAEILAEAGLLNSSKASSHGLPTNPGCESTETVAMDMAPIQTEMDKSANGEQQCACIACTCTMSASPLQQSQQAVKPKSASSSPQQHLDLREYGLKFKVLFMWRYSMRENTINKVPFPPELVAVLSIGACHCHPIGRLRFGLCMRRYSGLLQALRSHEQARKRKALLAVKIPTLAASFVHWRTFLDWLSSKTCQESDLLPFHCKKREHAHDPQLRLTPCPTQFAVSAKTQGRPSGLYARPFVQRSSATVGKRRASMRRV